MTNPPTAAIAGYGFAGRSFHSYLIGLEPGLHLKGIASRSAEKQQKIRDERGCEVYESLDAILADDAVDLVVLATPSAVHAEQAIAAMRAGKHVVTDKPAATNLAEFDQLAQVQRETGKHLFIFQNRRWDGDYLTVRKLMDEGVLTNVRRAEMWWAMFGKPRGWRAEADKAGGRLFDLGSHMIDQLCLLFPEPIVSVYAAINRDADDCDVETDATVIVRFEGGATGIIQTGTTDAIRKPRFYVTGPGGSFIKYGVDPQEPWMKAGAIEAAVEDPANYGRLNTTGKAWDEQIVKTEPGTWRAFYANVAATLRGEAEPAIPLETVRRQISVLDAAFESERTGQVVKVEA